MWLRLSSFLAVTALTHLTSGCLPGVQATKQVLGAHYATEGVQIFSMGQSSLNVRGQDRLYVHIRLALKNSRTTTIIADPTKQRLQLRGKAAEPPAFAESDGRTGLLVVPPGGTGTIDLLFRIYADVDYASLQWQVDSDGASGIVDSLAFASIGVGLAPSPYIIWLPAHEGGQRYKISTMGEWARPSKRWHWWHGDKFCAWLAQAETIDTRQPIFGFGSDMWTLEADDVVEYADQEPSQSPAPRGRWKVRRASPSRLDEAPGERSKESEGASTKSESSSQSGSSTGSGVAKAWRSAQ